MILSLSLVSIYGTGSANLFLGYGTYDVLLSFDDILYSKRWEYRDTIDVFIVMNSWD